MADSHSFSDVFCSVLLSYDASHFLFESITLYIHELNQNQRVISQTTALLTIFGNEEKRNLGQKCRGSMKADGYMM